MPDFTSLSLTLLGGLFVLGGALVWYSGTKLARYADEISNRTGIGHAVIGVILLGAVTSLPEISTTTVATLSGNSRMAVNNMLGGVAFQIVVIALADLFVGRTALTSMVTSTRTILNALVSVVLLVLALAGAMIGDWNLPGIGVGFFSVLIAAVYLLCMTQLSRQVAVTGWKPMRDAETEDGEIPTPEVSNLRLGLYTALAAATIFVGGTVVTLAAEAIAENTGTDSGLIGLTMLALVTSLPELSTAIAAVRLRRAELAIGDILGGNMFDVTLIGLIDALHPGEPILRQVDPVSMAAALLAVLLTVLYLIGLVERREKAVLRVGYDSMAVLLVYAAGIAAIVTGSFG